MTKYVCVDCVNDYAIEDFIQKNAINLTCNYCGKQANQKNDPIAASFKDIAKLARGGQNQPVRVG